MKNEPKIQVQEVMARDVRTIDSLASIRTAMEIMAASGISSLVVERRDEHDEYGILTVTDIARSVVAENHSFDRVNVYEVMTKPLLTIHAETDIRYAIRLLVGLGLSRAAVSSGDRALLGIVTLRDMVLRYAAARDESSAGG